MSKKKKRTGEEVLLYVYDLSEQNNVTFTIGMGAFHSGVVCYGSEYTFGQQGCLTHPPGKAGEDQPSVVFRQKVSLGKTDKSSKDVQRVFDELSKYFKGKDYDTLSRNCNHFADEFSKRVLGVSKSVIPKWVNRSAKIGNKLTGFFGSKKKEKTVIPEATDEWKAFSGKGASLSGKKVEDQTKKKKKGWSLFGSSKKKDSGKKEEKPNNYKEVDRNKILQASLKRLGN